MKAYALGSDLCAIDSIKITTIGEKSKGPIEGNTLLIGLISGSTN